jgi:hypothetical protein
MMRKARLAIRKVNVEEDDPDYYLVPVAALGRRRVPLTERRLQWNRHPFDSAQGGLSRQESGRFNSFTYEELGKRDRQSSRTRGRLRQHAGRARYLRVLVARRVLLLRRVSAVRRLRLLDHREDLRQGLRGYRARRMIRDDWPVLCVTRRFVRL